MVFRNTLDLGSGMHVVQWQSGTNTINERGSHVGRVVKNGVRQTGVAKNIKYPCAL